VPRPRISVLIPSRDRPLQLCSCVLRLADLCDDHRNFETIYRFDTDDRYASSSGFVRELKHCHNACQFVVGPRHSGWKSNHIFYNEAAEEAQGEWLFLYNDDATMLTKGWDTKILNAIHPSLATSMYLDEKDKRPHSWYVPERKTRFSNCFPVLHRRAYEALGVFARHRHADVYLEWVTQSFQESVSVEILHKPRISLAPDAIRGGGWRTDFLSEPLASQLSEDISNLREAFPAGTL